MRTTKGVRNIDIIVKKHPTGNAAFRLMVEGDGSVRVVSTDSPSHAEAFRWIGQLAAHVLQLPSAQALAVAQTAAGASKAITKTGSTAGF